MAGGKYLFSQVPIADIPRSSFNRSFSHKTTFNSGYLIPMYVDEALPGDTFSCNVSAFARLATPIFPLMDNMYMDWFFFAIPYRLVWSNFQKFMGEQENPDDSTDYLVPQIILDAGGATVGDIYDYMGIPTGVPNLKINSLPLRAYNLVWNEWFRDQNLQDSVTVRKDEVLEGQAGNYSLLKRGKRHDYFTSALPWPQKGPGVELPLGTSAPVVVDPGTTGVPTFSGTPGATNPVMWMQTAANGSPILASNAAGVTAGQSMAWASQTGLMADLSLATAATINSLREAFQLQKLLERDARGGTRYVEILKAHFGVVSPDARLQRPEFLGGGSIPVMINPVAQTSGSPNDFATGYTGKPQGNLAGFGVAASTGIGFTKSFVEHCVVLGMCMVRADLSYQQGLNRMWFRRTKYDFYWPVLSHLGEQEILNKEIYCQGPAAVDTDSVPFDEKVFGYQERWAEYRYKPSQISGLFRSNAAGTLDSWHLAQDFANLPTLGPDFIAENPPVARVIAIPTEPEFIMDTHFRIKATRPMPVYSVPGLIDHF